MTLREWVDASPLTVEQIAAAWGVRRLALYRWCEGIAMPKPDNVRMIEQRTGGAVTARDMHDKYHARRVSQ